MEDKEQKKLIDDTAHLISAIVKNPKQALADGGVVSLKNLLEGHYKEALLEPVRMLIDNDRLTLERLRTPEAITMMQDIYETIDEQTLEQEKFEAIRNLYLNSLLEDEDPLHHVLLKKVSNMSLEEILVLHGLSSQESLDFFNIRNQPEWLRSVAEHSRMKHVAFVQDVIKNLQGQLLAQDIGGLYRPSGMGKQLYELISTGWNEPNSRN